MNKKTTLLLLTIIILLIAVVGYSMLIATNTTEPLPPSDPGVTLESASPAEITDEEVEQLGL